MTRLFKWAGVMAAVASGVLTGAPALAASRAFLGRLHRIQTVASTVPASGDVNPYGVAVVPVSMGRLVAGDVLVSNFNDRANQQGTGRTIMEISPRGRVRVFASLTPRRLPGRCSGGVGLTTGLVALRSGWVLVGSLPTRRGSSATMRAGCLVVLAPSGRPVETIAGGPINGPWDMTAVDHGRRATLFVTNVLNGTVRASPRTVRRGTVVRVDLATASARAAAGGVGGLRVTSETVIGRGLPERTDPSALVVGPTGVGFARGTLFVADSTRNAITAIGGAMTRHTATTGATLTRGGALNDPLGLAVAPNGDVLAANGGNGNLIEITRSGRQIATRTLDDTKVAGSPNGSGTLFGLAVAPHGRGLYFVDDGSNTLKLLR